MKPTLYILNVATREKRPVPESWMDHEGWEYGLEEGNFACDCNRSLLWFDYDHAAECGHGQFILVADAGYENPRFHPSTIKAFMVTLPPVAERWT